MNQAEFIDYIAEQTDLQKKDAERALKAVIAGITDQLSKGQQMIVTGLGTFKVSHRAARTYRDPKTGAPIEKGATNVPTFKAGKALKEAVNK